MKHTFVRQARRAGIAVAVGALAALGAATAQAANFVSATVSIEPRGEAAGGLTCRWRETGLGASQVVYYSCGATAVGVLKACIYKNQVIYNSPTRQDYFTGVVGGEHGEFVPFLSQKNGQIKASTTTTIPEVESATELCTAPSEEAVVAVRWCNPWIKDVTNGLVGATAPDLYLEFFSGLGTAPACQ